MRLQINPKLGPPLMLVFVTMTNILLITSLISILSDSFSKVISHARYVCNILTANKYWQSNQGGVSLRLFGLRSRGTKFRKYPVAFTDPSQASTSNRLTHFYPPLNLIPLIFIRPLRLFLSADKLRRTRIMVLKATHLPIVGAIWVFERLHEEIRGGAHSFSSIGPGVPHHAIEEEVSWNVSSNLEHSQLAECSQHVFRPASHFAKPDPSSPAEQTGRRNPVISLTGLTTTSWVRIQSGLGPIGKRVWLIMVLSSNLEIWGMKWRIWIWRFRSWRR